MNTTASDGAHDDEHPVGAIPRPSAHRAGRTEAVSAPEAAAPTSRVIPCPRSRAETVLLWTFGILEVSIDMASESIELARQRVRLPRG
jgi:hypothetical protein